MDVIKELVLLADTLDKKGLNKEADLLDSFVNKLAAKKKAPKKEKDDEDEKDKKSDKLKKSQKGDKDGDGDSDFKDIMMSRMMASGLSKDKADKKTKKHDS